MAENWKKGALHTHTLWSDGRNLPEVVLKTYRDRGFDFVCLSDHNIFPARESMFLPVAREEGPWPPMASRAELERAQAALPGSIVTERIAVRRFVKLKNYAALQKEFEEPGKFLVVPGEEITLMIQPYPCGSDSARRLPHKYLQSAVRPADSPWKGCPRSPDAQSALLRKCGGGVSASFVRHAQPPVLALLGCRSAAAGRTPRIPPLRDLQQRQ